MVVYLYFVHHFVYLISATESKFCISYLYGDMRVLFVSVLDVALSIDHIFFVQYGSSHTTYMSYLHISGTSFVIILPVFRTRYVSRVHHTASAIPPLCFFTYLRYNVQYLICLLYVTVTYFVYNAQYSIYPLYVTVTYIAYNTRVLYLLYVFLQI